MCKALEDLKMEGFAEGLEQRLEREKTIICNMLNRNMSIEDICALAECSAEYVEQIRREM